MPFVRRHVKAVLCMEQDNTHGKLRRSQGRRAWRLRYRRSPLGGLNYTLGISHS